MVDDVTTPLNLAVTPIEQEKLEETLLDVNVYQWLCEEKLSMRVVRTRVNRSAWDCQLSPNPHTFAIYLKFAAPKRFEECQCEDDDVHLHC